MKKILLISLLAFASIAGKSQVADSTTIKAYLSVFDSSFLYVDTLQRSMLVADSLLNYGITQGDSVHHMDKFILMGFDRDGKKQGTVIYKTEILPVIEVNPPKIKFQSSVKLPGGKVLKEDRTKKTK